MTKEISEVEEKQRELGTDLDTALDSATLLITKNYLDELEKYAIVEPTAEDIDVDIAECGRFYKLTKLVLNKEENFLNKLTTIVNVASSINCSLATIIKSDGGRISYYFGIVSKHARANDESNKKRRIANAAAFKGALSGNLVGSELQEVSKKEVNEFCDLVSQENNCYSAVSGIVALRDEDDKSIEGYVQGIENLVDSLKGQKYTIIMLADPVDTAQINTFKQGYEMLHTQLATFAHSSVTLNESDTLSLSKAHTDSISEGISTGIATIQSKTKSKGYYGGVSISGSAGLPGVFSVGAGITGGINRNTSNTTGSTETTLSNKQKSEAQMLAEALAKTQGKSLQLVYENRSVKALLDKIDKNLERLDKCESFGAFECAAYVVAENRETALTVASNYNALMRGQNSSVQASHINSWHKKGQTDIIGQYLKSLVHPRFQTDDKTRELSVTAASIIGGNELAIQIGLPKKSVSGVTVINMAPFGRNVTETSQDAIELGNLYHMGHEEGGKDKKQKVKIDIQSLAMHTFITGSTGTGKSTTIYAILDKLMEQKVHGQEEKIKFMVIEPAKGEYKNRFGSYPDVSVYGTNYKKMPLLRINPFSFPEDIHVLEHIDRLVEIFNVCWPMYAAMPAVLKDAIERAYIVSGWNLESSECHYKNSRGKNMFPSFVDVLRQINVVMEESAYSSDSKGDYKGALCTRLKSLTNGLYGQIFTNNELAAEELFDKNVIVDLSRTGSSETKALIMGLLVMKLQEHRMANSIGGNLPLKHVTVLEEAHNILKRTSTEQSNETANLLGKSVEMLANSVAEMRTYGEGFIIADQAPGLMDLSVIRNTNTKIILRLPDLEDRELVGRAASLNDEQILELSRIKNFVAAVYQNNWLEPVLCNVDTNFKKVAAFSYTAQRKEKNNKDRVLAYLLLPIAKKNELDAKYITQLIDDMYKLDIASEARTAFIRYIKTTDRTEVQKLKEQIVYALFNSELAFELASKREYNIDTWYKYMKDVLEPKIGSWPERNQRRIITMLAKERTELYKNLQTEGLFEKLMNYM